MEILMKLKCSPAASTHPPHSSLKVVDHQHQLQHQHIVRNPAHMQPPLMPTLAGSLHEANMLPLPSPLPPSAALMLPTCLEYATTMDCCSTTQQDTGDLQWDHAANSAGTHRGRTNIPLSVREPLCSNFMYSMYASQAPHATASQSPMNLACCAAYEAPCCSAMPFRATVPVMPPIPLQQSVKLQNCRASITTPLANADEINNSFAYQEPEENFISIDDAKIKGFLIKIGEEEKQKREQQLIKETVPKSQGQVVYEIIELDDEELQEAVQPKHTLPTSHIKEKRTSQLESRKEKIVARIDLLDSSSESESNADEETMPLPPEGAASSELQCDLNDKVEETEKNLRKPVQTAVVILNSDDEEENFDFIDEEEGVELRGDDFEENRDRTFFECFLCGKKVQSSYNLRRHMMIHTGERPFGCDMCERRFREFSDLKKHRRRHVHEHNFVCMICRINTPTEHDPTRCLGCDTKTAAAMRLQVSSSPEQSQTSPAVLRSNPKQLLSKLPSCNFTPALPTTATPSDNSRSPTPLPPLAPLGTLTAHSSGTSDTQSILEKVVMLHQSSCNKQGVLTRKEFPCPLCQRPFGTRHNLKRHFMIHTGEKPFDCLKCRKPFREYSTLKKHQMTHKRDRWYKCHFCAYKSRDYLNYMDHKSIHPRSNASGSPTKKKPRLQHAFYDDSFDSNEDDSSAEDYLECCECGQRFIDIEVYTEHLKEHDPTVFLYECYICKQTLAERELLVKHLAEHMDQSSGQVEVTTNPCRENSARKMGNRQVSVVNKQNEE